jgi:hypothetical protein
MTTTLRRLCAAAWAAALIAPAARAQEPQKPGPEHDLLKKQVGTWDVTMKMMGQESKGSVTYKMDLGDLWLTSDFRCEVGGMKFQGRGMDSYSAIKKAYVGIWIDSMSTYPLTMEGTFDKEKKTLTMTGESLGPDGKMTKHKAVSEWKDDDTILFGMYMGDGKEPTFTILYKRKK